MSAHSVSTRLNGAPHAHVTAHDDRWPALLAWDDAGEFALVFADDVTPTAAVQFAADLAAAARKFAEATRREAARRTGIPEPSPKEAAA